jgi:hypothetical protein
LNDKKSLSTFKEICSLAIEIFCFDGILIVIVWTIYRRIMTINLIQAGGADFVRQISDGRRCAKSDLLGCSDCYLVFRHSLRAICLELGSHLMSPIEVVCIELQSLGFRYLIAPT